MHLRFISIVSATLTAFVFLSCPAQESNSSKPSAEIAAGESARTIIVMPDSEKPPKFLYAASASARLQVQSDVIEQSITVDIRVVQGNGNQVSLGLRGAGQVTGVTGQGIESWSVRTSGADRFVDLQLKGSQPAYQAVIQLRTAIKSLPSNVEVPHLSTGSALAFDSSLRIEYAADVAGQLVTVEGFVPLVHERREERLQTSSGGNLTLRVDRRSGLPPAVDLIDTQLVGQLQPGGKSVNFRLSCEAIVSEADARIRILSGGVALAELPQSDDYRLELHDVESEPVFELVFPKPGNFPVELQFVAPLDTQQANWYGLDFTIATSAVVPFHLEGLPDEVEFARTPDRIVPIAEGEKWSGFLPATGHVGIQWKVASTAGEGKLIFATNAQVEASVGPGLLRVVHRIDYQLLQGQLKALSFLVRGPGEILDVEGAGIVGWKVTGEGAERRLDVTLSQPLSGSSQISVRSQTPVGAFPNRVEGLILEPEGAIRHSGYLRISNSGSVSVEPTNLSGLTQLAPEQFPGEAISARQVFAYRFPSVDYAFSVVADRIQPEVSVTQLLSYELSESDRAIDGAIELDIRESTIREWNLGVPEDYSIVALTGASVADYVVASNSENGLRNVKVLFGQEIQGRQLINLRLEKNQPAAAGQWTLPRLDFVDAKAVRGDIGIVAVPGYRISVDSTDLLVEKPLSYFPKRLPNLQQAFRMREPGWSATVTIEALEQSIQSDVFHLYSLSQGSIYGSALVNYFITGAPTAELQLTVPAELGNITVDGQDIRTWRRDGSTLIVSLHHAASGAYTLLITFEQQPAEVDDSFQAGVIAPLGVQGDRGYIEIVSPVQVELEPLLVSNRLLVLDPLELPAEFRLLSTAPTLGAWQYTERPFELKLQVKWFEPGTTAAQVVEYSEATSRVSPDGQLVTEVLYYVKSRGQRSLRLQLPEAPVRLWHVSVNGSPVTARQSAAETLIPLPAGADLNEPVEVRLLLGKPAVDAHQVDLRLPIVDAPVLKTRWNLEGDENHLLVAQGGTVEPAKPAPWPSGFAWLADRGFVPLLLLVGLVVVGRLTASAQTGVRWIGVAAFAAAVFVAGQAAWEAFERVGRPQPLQLNVPILAAGETMELTVTNLPTWLALISWVGFGLILGAVALFLLCFGFRRGVLSGLFRLAAWALLLTGVLLHAGGAPWFFGLVAAGVFAQLLLPALRNAVRRTMAGWREWRKSAQPSETTAGEGGNAVSPVVTTILLWGAINFYGSGNVMCAGEPSGYGTASSLIQQWQLSQRTLRLEATAKLTLRGQPGDQFVLLRAPAVLTEFSGPGLRLNKVELPDGQMAYVLTIPASSSQSADGSEDAAETESAVDRPESADANGDAPQPRDEDNDDEAAEQEVSQGDRSDDKAARQYSANFKYQLEGMQPAKGLPVLTGLAAMHQIELRYDQPGWDIVADAAARIEVADPSTTETRATILLEPRQARIVLHPRARDLSAEETHFFVESSQVYTPGPGVVDGQHRFNIRTSQGRVQSLQVRVPVGLTVSEVEGPIARWQFDADQRLLRVELDGAAESNFVLTIGTQRGLEPLPTTIEFEPMRIEGADGEVGLLALAFAADAQPEKVDAQGLSQLNLGDFDTALLTDSNSVLHRVYRYDQDPATLEVLVAPVSPEVKSVSRQVLSFGDERVILSINFSVEISRTGLFQLSFPLPAGLEVESLSGGALHHWSELNDQQERQIVLHLNGKTLGTHEFSLTLTGTAPVDLSEWAVPRFALNEADRQSGELVVQPITGIRLRAVSRANVSEADPRTLGGQAAGALAFRLLQRDWSLTLGIEKLEPWVTGQVLHEVILREGQTRSTLFADFTIENASIRTLAVTLPLTDENELKTVRASGENVSDLVRTDAATNRWELKFARRVIGRVRFQIEFERRGQRVDGSETLEPFAFPDARQLGYHYAIRAGGRLEVAAGNLTQGWQANDWNAVPQSLREAGGRNAPALVLRAQSPTTPLAIRVIRHSLADALKLRVAQGALTTILSPTGDQLTSVEMTIEVIQRSSLDVQLPVGGELFSIFVNGESVHSIRRSDGSSAWQFYILPGIDDRTAQVRFVYSLAGDGLRHAELVGPSLNVPLENMQWNVVAPEGFELRDHDGNLELIEETRRGQYDRQSYLEKVSDKRELQARQATELLEQANQLLQAGEQKKASWALNNVANSYALDAASNEDARVQLENLQTQQAVVGLNSRRQRLYLDNNLGAAEAGNDQLLEAASNNPVLQQDQLNFRPQELSQLLAGNSREDNTLLQRIASRIVQHQRATEPAPQAIAISLPAEGTVYRFGRTVQVAENAPLQLELQFGSTFRLQAWQWAIVGVGLFALSLCLARRRV